MEDCYTSRGGHRLPSLGVGKRSHSIALFHNRRTFPTLVCHSSNNSENQFDDANNTRIAKKEDRIPIHVEIYRACLNMHRRHFFNR